MPKIKICGLKRVDDIKYVNELMPDFIGFVFAGTKRKIDFDTAFKLKKMLNPDIKSVGVFVNENPENIIYLANENIINLIQLHGDEDEKYIRNLKKETDKKIIKAVRVKSKEDILNADNSLADYLLLDTFAKGEYGGTGVAFDHSIIPDIKHRYFLAGGIGIENIHKVISDSNAYCIDVSSLVETDGVKDFNKIKSIIDVVRNRKDLT